MPYRRERESCPRGVVLTRAEAVVAARLREREREREIGLEQIWGERKYGIGMYTEVKRGKG